MAFKSFKIDHSDSGTELDPIKIFNSLTLRGSVNDLWPPQVDALEKWQACRTTPDISIEMNTGGGKTLVGLLVATSLARELGKLVLFASPTIQLVQQTAARAKECSIDVATYYRGTWTNEDCATRAKGPCLTTQQALFNGLSIFRNREIGAIVLDDAHAAGGIIRDCFTLTIPRSSSAYTAIANEYKSYFYGAGYEITFNDVVSGSGRDLLFVPLFESSKRAALVKDILLKNDVDNDKDTKFAWAHLKDNLDKCVVLFNNDRIEIAPACPPTEQTLFFDKGVRRVYLSATLPSPIEFYRTFGVLPESIRPKGRLGEGQRVFLNAQGSNDEEQRDHAKALTADQKALILTTSFAHAEQWDDVASLFDHGDGHERVEEFADAEPPEKLVMAGRYDGVDLPGDACRILILDGLSRADALLPRYLNETLHIEVIRAATTAIRFTQAAGRIFRSNTDHGAVVLVGSTLRQWISSPAHRAYLPPLVQRQMDLSDAIHSKIDLGELSPEDVLTALLEGTKEWDSFYNENIDQFSSKPTQAPPEWLTESIRSERSAHKAMWAGNFAQAATEYSTMADTAQGKDEDLAAWLRHFEGYCWERSGKHDPAYSAYVIAANQRGSLGRPKRAKSWTPSSSSNETSEQAARIYRQASKKSAKTMTLLKQVGDNLVLGPKTKPAEQAIEDIGTLLGLDASRPDNTKDKGPDVLWLSADSEDAWGFEAKTDKKEGSKYNKDDTGQAHEHRQWMVNEFPDRQCRLALVGRMLPVTSQASPDASLAIIDLDRLRDLFSRLHKLYEHVTANGSDESVVHAWLAHEGLVFPKCVDSLPMKLAIDMQEEPD